MDKIEKELFNQMAETIENQKSVIHSQEVLIEKLESVVQEQARAIDLYKQIIAAYKGENQDADQL